MTKLSYEPERIKPSNIKKPLFYFTDNYHVNTFELLSAKFKDTNEPLYEWDIDHINDRSYEKKWNLWFEKNISEDTIRDPYL